MPCKDLQTRKAALNQEVRKTIFPFFLKYSLQCATAPQFLYLYSYGEGSGNHGDHFQLCIHSKEKQTDLLGSLLFCNNMHIISIYCTLHSIIERKVIYFLELFLFIMSHCNWSETICSKLVYFYTQSHSRCFLAW